MQIMKELLGENSRLKKKPDSFVFRDPRHKIKWKIFVKLLNGNFFPERIVKLKNSILELVVDVKSTSIFKIGLDRKTKQRGAVWLSMIRLLDKMVWLR